MLLKITRKCLMGCNHCIENATPDGEHMTIEVFENTLEFLKRINPFSILITGGEPTDSPNFFYIMKRLIM